MCNPLDFYLPTWEEFALAHTSPNLGQNLFSDQLRTPLLYIRFTL